PERPKGPGKAYQMVGTAMFTSRQVEGQDGEQARQLLDAGQNPPDGAVVHYYLRQKPAGEVTLTFLDGEGREIKTFTSKKAAENQQDQAEQSEATATAAGEPPGEQAAATAPAEGEKDEKEPKAPAEAGLNRFVWNLR